MLRETLSTIRIEQMDLTQRGRQMQVFARRWTYPFTQYGHDILAGEPGRNLGLRACGLDDSNFSRQP